MTMDFAAISWMVCRNLVSQDENIIYSELSNTAMIKDTSSSLAISS